MRRARLLLAAVFVFSGPAAAQTQPPIRIHFDMHPDPIPNALPLAEKLSLHQVRVGYMNWVLDTVEPHGVKIAHLCTGQFMELLVLEGSGGVGARTLRRLYANGGQVGSHSHREYRAGAFDWPDFPPNATLAQARRSWTDNITWVDNAIQTALGPPLPEPLRAINNVKGSHLPANEPDYHALMREFGITARQPGPEEDYYGWYGHHIWNPYRPSAANYMAEDLRAPFVQPTQGSVIGRAGIHHGVFQDMTAPAVKRQFLQLYLNWRHRDRMGLPEKIWTWGWGSHAEDFPPGSASRAAVVDVVPWLAARFAGRIEPTGSRAMMWDTHRGSAEAYLAWEARHPNTSSFAGHSLVVNWSEYPYLRAVAEELQGFLWQADLSPAPGVEACHLRRGPVDAVVLWRAMGTSKVDLSAFVASPARVVGLETGLLLGTDPSAVGVGEEPLIVTEEAPRVSVVGTPSIGSVIRLEVHGPPSAPAWLFLAGRPATIDLPHYGRVLLDPAAGLVAVGAGTIPPATGYWEMPFPIPDDPALRGATGYFQGVVVTFGGYSAKLTVNAPAVTVQ